MMTFLAHSLNFGFFKKRVKSKATVYSVFRNPGSATDALWKPPGNDPQIPRTNPTLGFVEIFKTPLVRECKGYVSSLEGRNGNLYHIRYTEYVWMNCGCFPKRGIDYMTHNDI